MSTTLICWCRNDDEVSGAALKFPCDYRYSGCRIAALPQTLKRLNGDDILIITAHGNASSIGEDAADQAQGFGVVDIQVRAGDKRQPAFAG